MAAEEYQASFSLRAVNSTRSDTKVIMASLSLTLSVLWASAKAEGGERFLPLSHVVIRPPPTGGNKHLILAN